MATVTLTLACRQRGWTRLLFWLAQHAPWSIRWIGADRIAMLVANYGVRIIVN